MKARVKKVAKISDEMLVRSLRRCANIHSPRACDGCPFRVTQGCDTELMRMAAERIEIAAIAEPLTARVFCGCRR